MKQYINIFNKNNFNQKKNYKFVKKFICFFICHFLVNYNINYAQCEGNLNPYEEHILK